MVRQNRRVYYYLAAVVGTSVAFTLAYNFGMSTWENEPQPLYRSLEVVFQTFTTTGYGEDAPWQTPQMNVLVLVMQLTGIGLILTAVDVLAVPVIRDALTVDPPTEVDGLEDHVVICEFTSRGEAFVEELESRGQDYVVVEPDRERATALHKDEYTVVHGDPESTAVLERVGIERATAVLADSTDDTNASIVLSAREVNPGVQVVTLVEDVDLAPYHRIAGADEVLSPRQLLGKSLASRVPTAVSTTVAEGVTLGDDFELVEIVVQEGSDLCQRTLAEARIRDRFGVNVIGAWFDGDFESPVPTGARMTRGTRLLVAGDPEGLAEVRDATVSKMRSFGPQDVVIAGFGESGSATHEALRETTTQLTVVDTAEIGGVDVVGDARDPDVLSEAGIEAASVLVLALGDDTAATFATLIARDLNPDLEILVRANEQDNEEKLRRAGADYVQSLAGISGRMMASTLFEDEEMLTYDTELEVVTEPAGGLAGTTVVETDVRAETGCTVLAVVRDGRTITRFDPETFELAAEDRVVLVGTEDDVAAFEAQFGA
jgi:Trk K+ transport system NAD-binding subunit